MRKFNVPEKYEGKKRYSWSEFGQFDQCKWSYWLGRFEKEERKDNIYSLCGGIVHDILEDLKSGKIEKENIANRFKEEFNDIMVMGYRFDKDEEKNEQMQSKYYYSIKHYLENYTFDENIEDEQLEYQIWTDVEGRPIMGFVDKYYKQNGSHVIIDYKTSSMYSKSNQEKYQGQLIIYAKELVDKGINPKDIKLYWDFIKYTRITFKTPTTNKVVIESDEMKDALIELGYIKTKRSKYLEIDGFNEEDRLCDRNEIGTKMTASVRKMLKAEYYSDEQIQDIIDKLIKTNNLNAIPQHIINKYEIKMNKAYVEIPFDKDILKETQDMLLEKIIEMESYFKLMEELPKEKQFTVFERPPIDEANEGFYCSKLCDVNHSCKYYKQYIDDKEIFVNDDMKSQADDYRGSIDNVDLDNEFDLDDLFDELDNLENDETDVEEDDFDLDDLLAD